MKVLATFDGSKSAEAVLAPLAVMAHMPDSEFTLFSVVAPPDETVRRARLGRPSIAIAGNATIVVRSPGVECAEDRGGAIERVIAERCDYLKGLVAELPAGPRYAVEVAVGAHPASEIVQYAMKHQPDVVVMGTFGESGMIHRIFGDVAEEVVRAGVAPTLLVHPNAARKLRAAGRL